jgi:prepilin-type N-terminal cleavage/methylation domain-containing protein
MKGSRKAFTLPELLVVFAILAVMAGILFPVFYSARSAAKRIGCITNFRQAGVAVGLYLQDYDDTYMPVNYKQPMDTSDSKNDRTWVQLIMPYAPDYGIFRCPADNSDRPRREGYFEADAVPGDTYSQYYTASLRTNLGFNFVYFSPIYEYTDHWASQPKSSSQVTEPADTYLFIDSVWALNQDHEPTGGGSWLVVPPCRQYLNGEDSFKADPTIPGVFTNDADGWDVGQISSPLRYGQAWPWHFGKMSVVAADGHAYTVSPNEITNGCDLLPNWNGRINDPEKYGWDLK